MMKWGEKMEKGWLSKRVILLILIIVVGIIVLILQKYHVWDLISIEYLRRFTDKIRNLGLLGIILYIIIFSFGTMLFLPSLPFILFGGITYGTFAGIIYSSIADLLSASMAFIAARYIIRKRIERMLRKNKTFHDINKGVKEDGWRILIVTRMVPVIPRWLQNYAYGLTVISFKTYALVSLLCIVPVTAVWIIAVNTVGRGEEDARKTMIYLGIAAVLIVVISYIPKYIYKKKLMSKK